MTGINPKIWGKSAWIFLHAITFNYPENPTPEDIRNYKLFFDSLQFMLPCDKCKRNYAGHLTQYPLTDSILSNKNDLIHWLIQIRNLTEPNKVCSLNTIKEEFKQQQTSGSKKSNMKYYVIIGIIILVLAFVLYYVSKNNE